MEEEGEKKKAMGHTWFAGPAAAENSPRFFGPPASRPSPWFLHRISCCHLRLIQHVRWDVKHNWSIKLGTRLTTVRMVVQDCAHTCSVEIL